MKEAMNDASVEVMTLNASEVNLEEIEFPSDFTAFAPKTEQKLVQYQGFNFLCRELTPMETNVATQTSLPRSFVDMVQSQDPDQRVLSAIDRTRPETAEAEYCLKVYTVVMGVVKPVVTKEQVETFPLELLNELYNAITGDMPADAVEMFPETDDSNGTGQTRSGDDS